MASYSIYSGNRTSGEGVSFSASNLVTLSKRTGIGYWNLVRVFIRDKKKYWETRDGWVIIRNDLCYKSDSRGKANRKY